MELHAHRVGPYCGLRIENLVPLIGRQDEDIVGRRLRRDTGGNTNRLKERIRVRKVNDTSNFDFHRGQPYTLNRDSIAYSDMQIGGRLLCYKYAIQRPDKQAKLGRKVLAVLGTQPNSFAGASGLERSSCAGSETGSIGITDLL
jgi:hypothetical protein